MDSKQQIVKACRVLECQWVEFVRYGEHDVEVAGVEQFPLPRLEPTLAGCAWHLGQLRERHEL